MSEELERIKFLKKLYKKSEKPALRYIDLQKGKKAYESFDSRRQVGVDKSEWIVVRDTHEGIVTQEEFDRASGNMRSVVQGRKREPANKGNYSVIVCPHCGLTLRPGTQKESVLYCPTGRMHRESPCRRVRMKKALAEDTLEAGGAAEAGRGEDFRV